MRKLVEEALQRVPTLGGFSKMQDTTLLALVALIFGGQCDSHFALAIRLLEKWHHLGDTYTRYQLLLAKHVAASAVWDATSKRQRLDVELVRAAMHDGLFGSFSSAIEPPELLDALEQQERALEGVIAELRNKTSLNPIIQYMESYPLEALCRKGFLWLRDVLQGYLSPSAKSYLVDQPTDEAGEAQPQDEVVEAPAVPLRTGDHGEAFDSLRPISFAEYQALVEPSLQKERTRITGAPRLHLDDEQQDGPEQRSWIVAEALQHCDREHVAYEDYGRYLSSFFERLANKEPTDVHSPAANVVKSASSNMKRLPRVAAEAAANGRDRMRNKLDALLSSPATPVRFPWTPSKGSEGKAGRPRKAIHFYFLRKRSELEEAYRKIGEEERKEMGLTFRIFKYQSWRKLSDQEKEHYLELEEQDKERISISAQEEDLRIGSASADEKVPLSASASESKTTPRKEASAPPSPWTREQKREAARKSWVRDHADELLHNYRKHRHEISFDDFCVRYFDRNVRVAERNEYLEAEGLPPDVEVLSQDDEPSSPVPNGHQGPRRIRFRQLGEASEEVPGNATASPYSKKRSSRRRQEQVPSGDEADDQAGADESAAPSAGPGGRRLRKHAARQSTSSEPAQKSSRRKSRGRLTYAEGSVDETLEDAIEETKEGQVVEGEDRGGGNEEADEAGDETDDEIREEGKEEEDQKEVEEDERKEQTQPEAENGHEQDADEAMNLQDAGDEQREGESQGQGIGEGEAEGESEMRTQLEISEAVEEKASLASRKKRSRGVDSDEEDRKRRRSPRLSIDVVPESASDQLDESKKVARRNSRRSTPANEDPVNGDVVDGADAAPDADGNPNGRSSASDATAADPGGDQEVHDAAQEDRTDGLVSVADEAQPSSLLPANGPGEIRIGLRASKLFADDKLYHGTIVNIDAWYGVQFDDGDYYDMNEVEIRDAVNLHQAMLDDGSLPPLLKVGSAPWLNTRLELGGYALANRGRNTFYVCRLLHIFEKEDEGRTRKMVVLWLHLGQAVMYRDPGCCSKIVSGAHVRPFRGFEVGEMLWHKDPTSGSWNKAEVTNKIIEGEGAKADPNFEVRHITTRDVFNASYATLRPSEDNIPTVSAEDMEFSV